MASGIKFGDVAAKIGIGLVGGILGTAAITLSQMIEMRLRGREPSTTPAKAASHVLGVEDVLQTASPEQKQTLSQVVHWSYGTSLGAGRALLDLFGVRGLGALVTFFGAVWAAALAIMPSLTGSKPATEWQPEEIAISGFHHLVYALAVTAAYRLLRRNSSTAEQPWYDHVIKDIRG